MIVFSERSPCLLGLNTEVGSALNVWSQPELMRVEGVHPSFAGDAFPNAAPNTVEFCCHRGALLADGQFVVQQHPQVFFAKLLSSLLTYSMYWCMLLFPRVQDLVSLIAEQHEGAVDPFLQLAKII